MNTQDSSFNLTRLLSRGFLSLLVLLCLTQLTEADVVVITGVVVDSSNAAVVGAKIEVRNTRPLVQTTSDAQGRFQLILPTDTGVLVVSFPGFKRAELTVSVNTNSPIEVKLEPDSLIARIDITPEVERIPASPFSQFNIPRNEIDVAGALTTDDILRQIPGFSLFRRAGSLSANPTSQGVSLRGVGATGASRSLVLLDGTPLNSPFGGWVYWNRLPRVAIESMETFHGGVSDLYGSGALGGVINITSRVPQQTFAVADISFGNQTTPSISVDAGKSFHGWSALVGFQALQNEGYILVPKSQRGTVDSPASVGDLSGSITITNNLRNKGNTFLRLNSFGESRQNGTPIQVNDTRISSIDLGLDINASPSSWLSFRAYGSSEIFNQNFSAVAADRNSEALTNKQHNPSQQIGVAVQWRWNFARRQSLLSGFEVRAIRGHSAEQTFASSRLTAHVDAGGRQRLTGAFVQDSFGWKSWFFTVGARFDQWNNTEGFSSRIPVSGATTLTSFQNRSETAVSPRISFSHRVSEAVSVGGSFYRAFRAPTLNELYRSFRVGNVVTGANSDLRAEQLTGGEIGLSVRPFKERLTIRGTLFLSNIDDPVASVTLTSTPALITRQRQNLGSITAEGVELSANYRLSSHWEFSGEYSLTASKIKEFPSSPILQGLMVPQVPRNQLNAQLSYSDEQWSAGLQGRMVGRQFDDDLNTLSLRSFVTFDAEISRRVSPHWKIFVATQNLTGVRYETGKTPVTTVGPPALIRVGAGYMSGH